MILFILPRFSGGGAERVSLNYINELYLRGYDVQLLVLENKGPLKKYLSEGIPLHNLRRNSLKTAIFSLYKKITKLYQ